eukprot:Awhi_evm1s6105
MKLKNWKKSVTGSGTSVTDKLKPVGQSKINKKRGSTAHHSVTEELFYQIFQNFYRTIVKYLSVEDIKILSLVSKRIFNEIPKLQVLHIPTFEARGVKNTSIGSIMIKRAKEKKHNFKINAIRLTWTWKDQGWVLDKDHFLVQNYEPGDHYLLYGIAGGGGGHALHVKNFIVVLEFRNYVLNSLSDFEMVELPSQAYLQGKTLFRSEAHQLFLRAEAKKRGILPPEFQSDSKYFFSIAEARIRGDAAAPYGSDICHAVVPDNEGFIACKTICALNSNNESFWHGRTGVEHRTLVGRVLCLTPNSYYYAKMSFQDSPPQGTIRVKNGPNRYDIFIYSRVERGDIVPGRGRYENGIWLFATIPWGGQDFDLRHKDFFVLVHKDYSQQYFDLDR